MTEEEKKVEAEIIQVITLYSDLMLLNLGRPYMGWNPKWPGDCKSWNAFAAAAESIRRLRADPKVYMLAQFALNRIPFPANLGGLVAARHYQNYRFFQEKKFYLEDMAPREISLEEAYKDSFEQSAAVLLTYSDWGFTRKELYESIPGKLSPFFILSDPEEAARLLEEDPPLKDTGLVEAWTVLKNNNEIRARLNSLWREIWQRSKERQQSRSSNGTQGTHSSPLPTCSRTKTSSDATEE